MGDAAESVLSGNSFQSTLQLTLRIPSSEADEEWELVDGGIELPSDVQQRGKVIQQLMAARGTKRYAKVQQQAAQSLGISVLVEGARG